MNQIEIPAGLIKNVSAFADPSSTYTDGELSIVFTLQNGIVVNGRIVITLPS